MKKIFMTLAAVAVAATMNAQLYVGGTLGFTSTNNKTECTVNGVTQSTELTTTNFDFGPEVGYKLNDKMAVGLALTFGYTSQETAKNPDTKDKTTNFAIKPYFRYTFVQFGKVGLFADGQIGIETGKTTREVNTNGATTSTDIKTSGFSIAIVPGVSYQASDKISVVAKLGNGLGFWNTKTTTPTNLGGQTVDIDRTANTFGLNLNSLNLAVSLYYNF